MYEVVFFVCVWWSGFWDVGGPPVCCVLVFYLVIWCVDFFSCLVDCEHVSLIRMFRSSYPYKSVCCSASTLTSWVFRFAAVAAQGLAFCVECELAILCFVIFVCDRNGWFDRRLGCMVRW